MHPYPIYAQPINNTSRVPAYQNIEKVGGFCNFLFKLPNIGGSLLGVDVFASFCARKEEKPYNEEALLS